MTVGAVGVQVGPRPTIETLAGVLVIGKVTQPLGAIGLRSLAQRGPLGGLLAAWAVCVPLLMLLPLEFPRRMVGGWHVPLGIASGLGLALCVAPVGRRHFALAKALAAALAGTTMGRAYTRASIGACAGDRIWNASIGRWP